MGWFRHRGGRHTPQREDALLVVDFETSGFSPRQGDQVVWLGAVWLEHGRIAQTYSLSLADADGLGVFGDAPPDVQRVSREQLVRWLADVMEMVPAVVAHNAPFDRKFAQAEFDAVGRTMPSTPWIDTVDLARALRPEWPDHKLTTCATQLGLSLAQHDALSDALACAHLLSALRTDESGRITGVPELLGIIDKHRAERHRPRRNDSSGLSFSFDVEVVQDPDGQIRISTPDYPICGQLYRTDIKDPAHLAAHEGLGELPLDASLEQHVVALHALTAAGCPTAGSKWAWLPNQLYGQGTTIQFDAALLALEMFRDSGIGAAADIEDAARSLNYIPLKASEFHQRHMAAWRSVGAWLAPQAPCNACATGPGECRHFDLAWQAASHMAGDVDRWAPLLTSVGVDAFLSDVSLAPKIRARAPREAFQALHEFQGGEPAAWAFLVTELGVQQEQQGNITTARQLFSQAVASGAAPVVAYDRLSLLLERAKEFTAAADIAEQGVDAAARIGRKGEVLAKRAARCAAKAGRQLGHG